MSFFKPASIFRWEEKLYTFKKDSFWENYPFPSLSLLSSIFTALSFLPRHFHNYTHTDSHTPSLPQCAGWLISPGLWTLAWQRARRRKSRESRSSGALLTHRHPPTLKDLHTTCPIAFFGHLSFCFCLIGRCNPRSRNICVASVGLCQFDCCLYSSFRYWRQKHKQCAWCSHLWRKIEI